MATIRFIKVPERVLDDLSDAELFVIDEALAGLEGRVAEGKQTLNAVNIAALRLLRETVVALRKGLIDADGR